MSEKMLTSVEAAQALGITRQRVQVLISNGQLPGAVKFGRDWAIPESSVNKYKESRQVGRPKITP